MQVIRTRRQRLKCNRVTAEWLGETHRLFNWLAVIFWVVIDRYPELAALSTREAADALEKLTHRTGNNPDPAMYSALAQATPYHFRRSAMTAAIGAYKSFASNRANWLERKGKAEEKAAARGSSPSFTSDRLYRPGSGTGRLSFTGECTGTTTESPSRSNYTMGRRGDG